MMSIEDEICDALMLEQILRKPMYGHFDHDSNLDIGPDEAYAKADGSGIHKKAVRQEIYLEPLVEEIDPNSDYITYRRSSDE